MSTLSTALALSRLQADNAAWSLLRSDRAAVAIAVLDAHLGGAQRRLAATDLFELVDSDLDDLRDHGFDLPRSGQAYCSDWRAAGILIRRPTDETRTETFELSPAAFSAIRYVRQLIEPRSTVTQSRLATIASGLADLARDTDPDASSRLRSLHAERARLDAEIASVSRGDVSVAPPRDARERAREIVELARELPDDFSRVRADLESMNRELRLRIIEDDDAQAHVLDEIFRGVDLLQESDAGRSFEGFYSMVLDPEVADAFQGSIDAVLARSFASELSLEERRFLRGLLRTLQERSGEVNGVMSSFARGLRRFVQSQEYQRDRVIRRLLRESIAAAGQISHDLKPYADTGLELTRTSVALRSISALTLHDPSALETTKAVVEHRDDGPVVDLATLRLLARATEIDLDELRTNVDETVDALGPSTLGAVLDRHPATQGVASVVGLVMLAERHGTRQVEPGADADAVVEVVEWPMASVDGERRLRATVPLFIFTERIR